MDVANESIDGHQADTPYIKDALGGGGKTGYDWLIKAFELAYERWPDAILVYNDYNVLRWDTDKFINLVGASIYIRPAALKVAKDDVLPIKVRARMETKTIEKIEL